ncbi:MAG: hypothetical protein ACK4G1_04065, partial [Ignavibacteria bacterium]
MTERMIIVTLLRAFIFLSTIFIIQFYFAKKLRNSLFELGYFKDKRKLSIAIVSLILFFDLFPVFITFAGVYGVLNPTTDFEIPKVFVIDYVFRIPSWVLILIIVQVFLLSAPIDLFFFALKKINLKISNRLNFYISRYFFILVIFFTGYIPLRTYYEFKNVVVEKRIYHLNSHNPELNNFRIAFISDIQADRFTNAKRVTNYISKINELNPDIVLAGGDFLTGD